MRTLDEVIKAHEICRQSISPFDENCKECPYHEEDENGKWLGSYCGDFHFDVLHYLKELRDMTDIPMEYFENGGTSQITCPKCHSEFVILDDPDGDHAQLLKCQALLQDFYRNDPLTWDELKAMEGKPVWIEDALDNGEWYMIECLTESGRFIAHDRWADDTIFKEKDMGDVWQAYRKERS